MTLKNASKKGLALIWNRQFFIFLFFLALSSVFWAMQALNETYEEDFYIPLRLEGVPGNVVVTTELPAALHVRLQDKGVNLIAYRTTNRFKDISIDFANYANAAGHVMLPGTELMKQVNSQLLPSTHVVAYKPDALDFYYNYGQCKRVPVVLTGHVSAGKLYSLAQIKCPHDSVTVYATREVLDTITGAYTQPLNLRNLTDTMQVKATFQAVRGAKFVPATTQVTFCIDRMVEKTVQVPVQQVNFPAAKQLRTFPGSVKVTFQVPMGLYRKVTGNDFVIVVNYEELLHNKTNMCRLALKSVPAGASHVRIVPQDVEFVIEDVPENEME